MSRRKPPLWPDYMSKETLAARLDVEPGYVDQLEKRGLLGRAYFIGEAKRFRWPDVESAITSLEAGDESHGDDADPYLEGIERGPTEEASH